jgi:hypothetical protein
MGRIVLRPYTGCDDGTVVAAFLFLCGLVQIGAGLQRLCCADFPA